MKCHRMADWLKSQPEGELSEKMQSHLVSCPTCRILWSAQSVLGERLRRLAPVEPPPDLKEKILAHIRQQDPVPIFPAIYPAWVTLAAILILFSVWGYLQLAAKLPPKESIAQSHIEIIIPPDPQTPDQRPRTTYDSAIFPVWPKHEDAILLQDLPILASIYPAPQPGFRVEVVINDQDISRLAVVMGQLVSLMPEDLKPGQHSLELRLCKGSQVLSTSRITFYLMEAPS